MRYKNSVSFRIPIFRSFLDDSYIKSLFFRYMQWKRNALSSLHEVHIQQCVLFSYSSLSAPNSTAFVRVSIPTAPLQIEFIHNLLVVEQILHHLSNNSAFFHYHIMRHSLAIAGVDHCGLVDPEDLAQQRRQAVKETFRHISNVSSHVCRY